MENSRRGLDLVRVVAVLVFAFGWVSSGSAQTSAPEPTQVESEVASLRAQVQTLIGQVAKLAAPKPPSEQERARQTAESYQRTFRAAKETFGPACKAVKGRLRVVIHPDGKLSVECGW